MLKAPPMHQVIALAGVRLTNRLCGCCLELPLYAVDPAATQADRGAEVFFVCRRCDVDSDRRAS